jgi:hypothetical protein
LDLIVKAKLGILACQGKTQKRSVGWSNVVVVRFVKRIAGWGSTLCIDMILSAKQNLRNVPLELNDPYTIYWHSDGGGENVQ